MSTASFKPESLAREQAERPHAPRRALETNLTSLMLALETLDECIWIWNCPTDELLVTSRWRTTLGYAEGELGSRLQDLMELLHPDDRPALREGMDAHLAGHTPRFEREVRLRRKDGQWSWQLSRARVIARDEQGHPVRVVGTNVEITASKRNEERMRALLSALPDLIFRQHRDGTYLDFIVNKPDELVISPQSLIGTNIRQLPMEPSLINKIVLHLERAIDQGTLEVFEYQLPVGGRLQHYESRIIRSAPDEAVCIIRNITERKLAEERLHQQEEELRRHRDHLEELVQSRTETLLQTTRELEERQVQLIQAEKLASLGQMAAGVAHEISSPVGYVLSNLATLAQYVSTITPLLEQQKEQWKSTNVGDILEDLPVVIEESLEGARRIKEIVQSLRMFAREDSGELQLAQLNTELESTLRVVWNELKYKCTVERDFGELPMLLCHPNQLAQVFTNLLVNAAQSIEKQGVIRIRTRHEGNEVVVSISDTGKGMEPETRAKLFTPFFTTKPRGQGTGLGLSVSQSIISRHHGRIEVDSTLGQGTTFRVYLPVAEI
ncbi:PAS domain-containing sensor histidine kinase [Hyalangium minutum]|uniref:histidine kinase n=1 Tax=Hyalangium minutum TaxID=394096 RepID=A0A085WB66_9BACT|nr:ATP-binding protein [Hyalangium minutum]KFE64929.1 hypothetical protein DB31_1947 [Hyalangium minutum]